MNDSISDDLADKELFDLTIKLKELVFKRNELEEEIKYLEELINDKLQEKIAYYNNKLIKDIIIKSEQQFNEIKIDIIYKEIGLLSYVEDFTLKIPRKISSDNIYDLENMTRGKKESDLKEKGENTVEKTLNKFKDKICDIFQKMENSGILDDLWDVYLVVVAILIGQGVTYSIATGIAGIIAKRGLKLVCN